MLLTPGLPPRRVPRQMNDRQDPDFSVGRDVEDAKREMAQGGAADRIKDHGISSRMTEDAFERDRKFCQQPSPEARALRFVPVPSLGQIALGFAPNADRQSHYSASSRSRTSAQGDPADGSDS